MTHPGTTRRGTLLRTADRVAAGSAASAVAGLLAFLVVPMRFAVTLTPILALAGIVLGVLGVRRIGLTGADGRGFATAGFVVGGITVVAFVFLLVAGAIEGTAS